MGQKMKFFAVYEIESAPWGDDYRLVEMFDTREAAEHVLEALNKVHGDFSLYDIVEWEKSCYPHRII